MGDELTRSRSALTFSGNCSKSRGVSGNSTRLEGWSDGWMGGCENGEEKEREKKGGRKHK